MSDQLDIFRSPAADEVGKYQRHGQTETSRVAAISELPKTGTKRQLVLAAIARSLDGLTDEEGVRHSTALTENTYRPRRVELVDGGWVEDSGDRRRTRSGKAAAVWVLTEKGRDWWNGLA